MAKKVGGFAAKHGRARDKREYSMVKYVQSVRSEKSGNWRFQEQILMVNDGETVKAALKRADAILHPAPEQIPVIQPESAAPKAEEKVEAASVEEAEVKSEEKAEEAVAEVATEEAEAKEEPAAK